MSSEKTIENISDTALWVAVYRAMESDRPDAHFHDPYARLLAGDKGEEIVERMPWAKSSAWAMIVRTCVFDELILKVIQRDGVDTILNLAAGLDTRPYRLQLPSTLRWIEVDLPGISDYKEAKLADQKPVCQLERVRLDLSDASGRDALFSRVDASAKKTLVLTEGLLVYLPEQAAIGLAKDLASRRTFQFWMIDIASPVLLKWLNQRFGKTLAAAGVKMQFAPTEGAAFFAPYGWEIDEFRPTTVEAQRLNRNLPHAWLWRIMGIFSSKEQREGFKKVGMALLRRKA